MHVSCFDLIRMFLLTFYFFLDTFPQIPSTGGFDANSPRKPDSAYVALAQSNAMVRVGCCGILSRVSCAIFVSMCLGVLLYVSPPQFDFLNCNSDAV